MKALTVMASDYILIAQSEKNLSEKTILAYQSDLRDFVQYVGDAELHEFIILEYAQYLLKKKHLKDSTISRKLLVLKMFFSYLYTAKYIPANYYSAHPFKFKKE